MCYLYIVILLLLVSVCFYTNKKNIEPFRNQKHRGNRKHRGNLRNYRNRRFRNYYSWIPFYNTVYPDIYWDTPVRHPTLYNSYNWFDYRTCPSGCVANSMSPSGFSCNKTDSITSCRTDYDCSGCNVPVITSYY